MKCPQCGAEIPEGSMFCSRCGKEVDYNVKYTTKSPLVASLLAIFCGTIGIHWFYVGKIKRGILSVVFWWTMIPCIIGIIKGIQWFINDDSYFIRDISE